MAVDPTEWEPAYDRLLAPLMDQIIAVCQAYEIPCSCVFQLTSGEDPRYCATQIPTQASLAFSLWMRLWQYDLDREQKQSEWRVPPAPPP